MRILIGVILTTAALAGCDSAPVSERAQYTHVTDAIVVSKKCMIVTSTQKLEPSTGATLVNAFVGHQLGVMAGEALGDKAGSVIGGAVGAATAVAVTDSSTKPPRTYCEFQFQLLDGTLTELIVEDHQIDTLSTAVSIVKGGSTYGRWSIIDRLPTPTTHTPPSN